MDMFTHAKVTETVEEIFQNYNPKIKPPLEISDEFNNTPFDWDQILSRPPKYGNVVVGGRLANSKLNGSIKRAKWWIMFTLPPITPSPRRIKYTRWVPGKLT